MSPEQLEKGSAIDTVVEEKYETNAVPGITSGKRQEISETLSLETRTIAWVKSLKKFGRGRDHDERYQLPENLQREWGLRTAHVILTVDNRLLTIDRKRVLVTC